MTVQIQVHGPCLAKIKTSGSWLSLGYTRNQPDIVHQSFLTRIPGDQNGGDEGPPIDVQMLGEIVTIRLELTKYDATVAANILARQRGATSGIIPAPGGLQFAGAKTIGLLLSQAAAQDLPAGNNPQPVQFPLCIVAGATEYGLGTRYSTFICELEAHMDPTTRVIWSNSSE